MATREQASKARAANADKLARKGVHAIGVEAGKPYGKSGFVVVAYVEPNKRINLPSTIPTDANEVEVPLVVERAEMFKPE